MKTQVEIMQRSDEFMNLYSPDSTRLLGKVPVMSRERIDEMIGTAIQAQKLWMNTDTSERANLLRRWAAELLNQKDDLAMMIMREVGKPLSAALSEVERTAELIGYAAEEGLRVFGALLKGDSFPSGKKSKMAFVDKEPLGVVLAISPFNYPVNLSASKIAPALIAGNAVIFKPATQGALSGIRMIEALQHAGMPSGLVHVVTGKGSEIGDYLVQHRGINMISFTGGTRTGQSIAQKASMIPIVLELGGKDPAVVLEDADLDVAVKEIVSGAFSYSGQRCTAIKRILAVEEVADRLVEKLKEKINSLKAGLPEEEATVVPLINTKSADYVQELLSDALQKGATLVTGGDRSDNLIYPTLLDHVKEGMRIAWEEQFGPVLPVIRVKNIDEAVRFANASHYGLQASVFTTDLNSAFELSRRLEAGTIQINGRPERGPDHFPFLGVKKSGLGVQGIRRSIESMMRDKVTVINL